MVDLQLAGSEYLLIACNFGYRYLKFNVHICI